MELRVIVVRRPGRSARLTHDVRVAARRVQIKAGRRLPASAHAAPQPRPGPPFEGPEQVAHARAGHMEERRPVAVLVVQRKMAGEVECNRNGAVRVTAKLAESAVPDPEGSGGHFLSRPAHRNDDLGQFPSFGHHLLHVRSQWRNDQCHLTAGGVFHVRWRDETLVPERVDFHQPLRRGVAGRTHGDVEVPLRPDVLPGDRQRAIVVRPLAELLQGVEQRKNGRSQSVSERTRVQAVDDVLRVARDQERHVVHPGALKSRKDGASLLSPERRGQVPVEDAAHRRRNRQPQRGMRPGLGRSGRTNGIKVQRQRQESRQAVQ